LIAGIGLDVCSIERLQRAIRRHGDRFLSRVFAEEEVRLCRGAAAQHLAARFAAK
jgi:holo-[acyl-carrier protein] synthase